MITSNYILDIITRFRNILDKHERHLECFDKYAIQVEGWLKGEMVQLFDSEKMAKKLGDFKPEAKCNLGRKRVDLLLKLNETPIWIELKHWQIGCQRNELWQAHNYFGDKSIGIYSDVEKLSTIADGDKYILVLATKNPGHEDWSKGVDKFNKKFKPLRDRSCTETTDFPQSYYVGVLEVIN